MSNVDHKLDHGLLQDDKSIRIEDKQSDKRDQIITKLRLLLLHYMVIFLIVFSY